MMRREVVNLLPIAGLVVGLLIALAIDPAAEEVTWWPGVVGLFLGLSASFFIRRRLDAR